MPICPKQERIRHSANYCQAQSAMNKAHAATPKTTSSQAEDNSNSSRAPLLPRSLGLAQWAAATGSIFSCTPMAWHSQAAKNTVYPQTFYEHSLQTSYVPQHRHAAPLGHALDVPAWTDLACYLRLTFLYFTSTRKNLASKASPYFIKTHVF